MNSDSVYEYIQVFIQLKSYKNIPNDLISSLRQYISVIYQYDQQNRFSEPMPWIGVYIALASLFCILAMVADLLHGFRNKKIWFPCKYFTLNAASLTVIAVALKLPVDLNNPMPGTVDQAAKIGSMAFMCTMMANLLPSLATMDNKELLTNFIALGVLVITLVVNVCIQITTGVLSYYIDDLHLLEAVEDAKNQSEYIYVYGQSSIATLYVAMLLMLLIIHACSSLAIIKSKMMLESKYQAGHETVKKDKALQQTEKLIVEKLKQHVSYYWIMAGTSSPQFIFVCSATTSASGVICALSAILPIFTVFFNIVSLSDYKSDYKWSMLLIFVIQYIGVILGTIAPLFRCFAALSFKLSIKWVWNHINVFKVESYWTQKLCDWKYSSIPFSIESRKTKMVIQNLKSQILSFCIGFQKVVVVTCKIIVLIPISFVICVLYCFRCWKWLKAMFSASITELEKTPEQQEQNKDLSQYVLQLQEDMVLAETTVKGISNSFNHLILKAEKKQPYNLMKLLEGSSSYEGVELIGSYHVPLLVSEDRLNCWSLSVVTLTSIAVSLNIPNKKIDSLLCSVSEGLVYLTLVEESLSATNDYASIQKAAKMLWLEVEVYHKWLGNKLRNSAPQVSTAGQIIQWFRDRANTMVTKVESTDIGGQNENSICRSISAYSMYRITETILVSYQDNIYQVSEEQLFERILSMIADIMAACLTNLPQVIVMKCHTSVIEKREASVHAAAKLLGETTEIINILHECKLPNFTPVDLPFIDKWDAYLEQPFP